jgi:hypothetical protein
MKDQTPVQWLVDQLPIRIKNSFSEEIQKALEMETPEGEITRLEVINHAKNDKPVGRLLTLYKELGHFEQIDLSYQDDYKTLKIFLG